MDPLSEKGILAVLRTTNSDFNNKSVYHIQDSLLLISGFSITNIAHNKHITVSAAGALSSWSEMSGCGSTEALGPARGGALVSVPCGTPVSVPAAPQEPPG